MDTDNVNLEGADLAQMQPPPPSASPTPSVNPDTRQEEEPTMYDAPGRRTTIADSVQGFKVAEGATEGLREREGFPGNGGTLYGDGDARKKKQVAEPSR